MRVFPRSAQWLLLSALFWSSYAMGSPAIGNQEPSPEAPRDPEASSRSGPRSYEDDWLRWQLAADAAYVVPFQGDIRSITKYTLIPYSSETEDGMIGMHFSGGIVNLRSGSALDVRINDPWMIEVGGVFRYYLIHKRTPVTPYLTGSAGYSAFFWDFSIPVDDDAVSSTDALNGYLGFGLAFWRYAKVSLFGEAGVGGIIFVDGAFSNSTQGKRPVKLQDFGYASFKAGLSFKF